MTDLNLDGLTDAQLRLFAVRCARRVQHLMTDPRLMPRRQGSAAWRAAWMAENAAWRAAEVERAVDDAAARGLAESAAWAARCAAADAAPDLVLDAAWKAERAEQQKILDEVRKMK